MRLEHVFMLCIIIFRVVKVAFKECEKLVLTVFCIGSLCNLCISFGKNETGTFIESVKGKIWSLVRY